MSRANAPSNIGTPHAHVAIRDAHTHLVALGQTMQRLDLSGCVDVHDCLARVSNAALEIKVIHNFDRSTNIDQSSSRVVDDRSNAIHARTASASASPWLIAWGLRPNAWTTPTWPTMHELDGACSDIPCFLAGFDHHSAVCNSAAFEFFGYDLTAHHPHSPIDGTIVRDANAQPTGLLLESAYTRARELIPQPSRAEARALVKSACEHMERLGYVEVHDLLAQPWLGEVLRDLDLAGELPIRVGLFAPMIGAPVAGAFEEFDAIARGARAWETPRLRFLGGKLFADGTLNSATAAMLDPYRHPLPHHPCGQLLLSEDQLSKAMAHLANLSGKTNLSLALAVHAIGDRAVRTTLDAYEHSPSLTRDRVALRIEHAEVLDAADVPRFQQLRVTASVQPCHLLYDIEVLERQLPHRLDRVLPLRELLDSGLVPGESLIFGSDVPIVRANAEDSIRAAAQRRRADMDPATAIAPAQAITEHEAWACFTAQALPST